MRSILSKLLVIAAVAFVLVSCGDGGSYDSRAPAKPQPTGDAAWDKAALVIAANCAGCHDGAKEPLLTPAATFKASPAKAKLSAGAMPPPPRTISAADKAVLLAYLGG